MKFIGIGENIHCTRVYKTNGKFIKPDGDGFAVFYGEQDAAGKMPIPKVFLESAEWQAGRLKHCAAAAWQGLYGNAADREAGVAYLRYVTREQERAGAAFLDLNVDEFSTDVAERVNLMTWLVRVVQEASGLPLSIDSSNLDILKAGIHACDLSRGRPLINSVSLERLEALELAAEFKTSVVASAAGETSLPENVAERLTNLRRLVQKLTALGFSLDSIYLDPLVFPVATESGNGLDFFKAVREARQEFGTEVHITGGVSNVSFGMPNRRLINLVFTRLALKAGADSGIVDPNQINLSTLGALNCDTEAFKITEALLLGEDEFGMEYLTAYREGRLAGAW